MFLSRLSRFSRLSVLLSSKSQFSLNRQFSIAFEKSDVLVPASVILDILDAEPNERPQLIDVRSYSEYIGDTDYNKNKGHIPTAINLPHTLFLTNDGQFKSKDEIQEIIASKGIDLNRPVITYCQLGKRAHIAKLAFDYVGAKDVKVYERGADEWLNSDYPYVK